MSEHNEGNIQSESGNAPEINTDTPESGIDIHSLREQYQLPNTWTDDEVTLWYRKAGRKQPPTVDENVFVYDPTRVKRPINEWPTGELLAYLEGKLIDTEHYDWNKKSPAISEKEVIQEYKRRVPVEPAWTDKQILDYFRSGIEPAKTSTGVWVMDVTRANRRIGQWSDAELIAWLRREITAVGNTTYAHLTAEINKRKIKDKPQE